MTEEVPLILLPLEPEFPIGLTVENQNELQILNLKRTEENKAIYAQHTFPWLFLLIVLLGTSAILGWKYFWKRPAVDIPVIPNPKEKALASLARIQAQYAEKSKDRNYYARIINVIRDYIEEVFIIFIRGKTTPEFLYSVSKNSDIPEHFKSSLGELLAKADLMKFAAIQPSQEAAESFYTQARELIELPQFLYHRIEHTKV